MAARGAAQRALLLLLAGLSFIMLLSSRSVGDQKYASLVGDQEHANTPKRGFTIFTCPKDFTGSVGNHQRLAIASWLKLEPEQIIIFGDAEGAGPLAAELGLVHVLDVPTTARGAPLLNALFKMASTTSSSRLLMYVNTDIVLPPVASQVMRLMSSDAAPPSFLMIGYRVNMVEEAGSAFHSMTGLMLASDSALSMAQLGRDSQWLAVLEGLATGTGTGAGAGAIDLEQRVLSRPYSPFGIDYFLYTRDVYAEELPPFGLGRFHWDNWMVHSRVQKGVTVVDASPVLQAIHMFHDYSHVKGSSQKFNLSDPDMDENKRLAGDTSFGHVCAATLALSREPGGGLQLVPRTVTAASRLHPPMAKTVAGLDAHMCEGS